MIDIIADVNDCVIKKKVKWFYCK